ncbi:MAG: glycosyltransferase family 2 protein [Candidatus Magasanikbacteria bacterium]|nr:glycosyltransferase family 2 protein [Candidatus Magasanikbacteria bacterium]
MNSVSIIIPVFNEEDTISELIKRASQADILGLSKEIIIVDDASTDRSFFRVQELARDTFLKIIRHSENQGKGAALHSGFAKASGDIILVQDADLEYSPSDYKILLEPLLKGEADLVYGSRFLAKKRSKGYPTHYIANRIFTTLSNLLSGQRLSDAETCYKVFKKSVLNSISLKENRFGFDLEFTARVSRVSGIRIVEVPVSYNPRSYAEGKKIGIKDGFRALYCIFRYNLFGKLRK